MNHYQVRYYPSQTLRNTRLVGEYWVYGRYSNKRDAVWIARTFTQTRRLGFSSGVVRVIDGGGSTLWEWDEATKSGWHRWRGTKEVKVKL